jgi:hypothetical protein
MVLQVSIDRWIAHWCRGDTCQRVSSHGCLYCLRGSFHGYSIPSHVSEDSNAHSPLCCYGDTYQPRSDTIQSFPQLIAPRPHKVTVCLFVSLACASSQFESCEGWRYVPSRANSSGRAGSGRYRRLQAVILDTSHFAVLLRYTR